MVDVVVWREAGEGTKESYGVHQFQFLPQIGHRVELYDPPRAGRVIDVIHSSSNNLQQTEIILQSD